MQGYRANKWQILGSLNPKFQEKLSLDLYTCSFIALEADTDDEIITDILTTLPSCQPLRTRGREPE